MEASARMLQCLLDIVRHTRQSKERLRVFRRIMEHTPLYR
jgi:hypothetical protein